MPRTTLALTSFVSGELGDKLSGRIDFAKYNLKAESNAKPFKMRSKKMQTQKQNTENAINTTNDVFYVAENTNNQLRMYAFNGTYQNAFVANSAAVDADYHDSHVVTLSSAAQTTVKISDHDAVGSPTDGSGATYSSYTRVN